MTSKKLRIAIVGGGPGGLCLARVLQHKDFEKRFEIVVFEAEINSTARGQGGSLDLHVETGQRALKEAGLLDKFRALVQTGGDALSICNAGDGKILYRDSGGGQRPEIERSDLRNLLLNSLEPGTIQWNKKLVRIEPEAKLVFADGTASHSFDVIVGADGAWSKVRPVLTDAQPQYAGISFWEVEHPRMTESSFLEGEKGAESSFWKGQNGTVFGLDHCGTVLISHMNSGSIHTYIGSRCIRGARMKPPAELLKGWDSKLVELVGGISIINSKDFAPTLRDIHALPIGVSWKRPPTTNENGKLHWTHRVTLLGDAAHVMSPMAGEGVNLALTDAADLANCIIQGKSLAEYEQRYLFHRAAMAARESHDNLLLFFHPQEKGAEAVARKMRQLMSFFSILIVCYRRLLSVAEEIFWTFGWRRVK